MKQTNYSPEGFLEGSGYISSYIPTKVTIQKFSITTPELSFLEINISIALLTGTNWPTEIIKRLCSEA